MALLSPTATQWLTVAVTGVVALASVSFAVTPAGGESLRPVDASETLTVGGTGVDQRRAESEGFVLPRAQVFYSGYRYVVSYVGVGTAASVLADGSARRQFGDPLAVYVSDFSGVSPALTDRGYVVPQGGRHVGWTPADTASFVVGSDAAVPSGPVTVPFSERADAERFAAAHGGDVVDWETLQATVGDPLPGRLDRFEASTERLHSWGDRAAAAALDRQERPLGAVVGDPTSVPDRLAADRDGVATASTIEDAIAAAPPNTTVYVPSGTYAVDRIVVNRSVTLAGAGDATVIRGDGNGSVVHLRADGAALADLRITGVGTVGSRGSDNRNETAEWDTTVQLAYGYGDAGVVLDGAADASVSNVEIDTPASGVIVRESPRSAITNSTVRGAATAAEGFMGVVLIGAPSLVQGSTFHDGRDGIYTHRADGSVLRDNRAEPGRYGVHEMYTSASLVANNTVRDAQAGVIVMTRPTRNLVVENTVSGSTYGVVPAGGDSYYADNVVVDNAYGLQVAGDRNVFADNVVADNDVGVRANEILPTNRVLRNDFVDNGRTVASSIGPLRVWTHRGVGNHWGRLPIADTDGDGVYDRPYRPSGAVDSRLGTVRGATVLAESPALAMLRRVQQTVSGLRESDVVDTAARTRPFDPETVANVTDRRQNATGPGERP